VKDEETYKHHKSIDSEKSQNMTIKMLENTQLTAKKVKKVN